MKINSVADSIVSNVVYRIVMLSNKIKEIKLETRALEKFRKLKF